MRFPFLHPHFLLQSSEVREVYLNRALRMLGFGLIGVFIPVYLYESGYSLFDVFLFLTVLYSAFLVFSPVSAFLESKIGVKRQIVYSVVLLLIYVFMLITAGQYFWPVWLMGLIHGAEQAMYWIPTNANFANASKHKFRGTQSSNMIVAGDGAAIFAPVAAALLFPFVGFEGVILMACIFFVLSVFPLLLGRDYIISVKDGWRRVFSRANSLYFNEFMVNGLIMSTYTLWMFYIYLMGRNYLFLGVISTAIGIVSSLFTLWIGRRMDVVSERVMLRMGAAVVAAVWFGIMFLDDPLSVSIISIMFGLAFVLVNLPLFVVACNASRKQNPVEFMAFREVALCVGRIIAMVPVLIAPTFIGFKGAFLLAGAASLMLLFVKVKR